MVMDVHGVSRSYCHGKCMIPVFVKLPVGDAEEGMCGELVQPMCGASDAARHCGDEVLGVMANQQMKSSGPLVTSI